MSNLLEVQNLSTALKIDGKHETVLHDVSLTLAHGEALGLVGESGSGKSMTAFSIAQLLPRTARTSGTMLYEGSSLDKLRGAELRKFRREVAVIFQNPRSHVNPLRKVGDFMTEALRSSGVKGSAAAARAAKALQDVGIPDTERRLNQYPHELSGGLLQRVMIASALLTEPKLLLADEPTTALDVTSQSEVMAILDELRRERGMALIMITHDLDLADAVCDRTAVLYAGSVVEVAPSRTMHRDPLHPYTAALAGARPRVDERSHRLPTIPGTAVSAFEAPAGCSFSTRCRHVTDVCRESWPELVPLDIGDVRCFHAAELRGRLSEGVDNASVDG